MYTVIKNKVYDTSTAKSIAEYHSDGLKETLYRKKTGEYFCHFYDEDADNEDYRAGWRAKEKIVPYDYETARDWARISLDEAKYERLFGDSAECGTTTVTVRISQAAADRLYARQSATGETVGQIIERLAESV